MSGDLTSIRVTLPGGAGEPPRVEVAARPGLAREVLIDRAIPLLARARRLLDNVADPDGGAPCPAWARQRAEVIADAIADLIGHSTTDSPPADELEAVFADGRPARLTLEQLRNMPGPIVAQLPASALPLIVEPTEQDLPGRTLDEVRGWGDLTGEEYAHIRYGRPMSGDPLTRKEAEEWAGPTTATCAACGGLIETDRSDFFVRGRWRHVGARTWDHAAVPETPADREARCAAIDEALDGMGIAVIPLCPMAPYAESGEQPTPHVCQVCDRPLALHGYTCAPEPSEWEQERAAASKSSEPATRVVTCTCGARPGQGHQLRCAVLA